MGGFSSDSELSFPAARSPSAIHDSQSMDDLKALGFVGEDEGSRRMGRRRRDPWLRRKLKKNQVFLEGFVEASGEEEVQEEGVQKVARTKSLTDEDLDELKGCVDLGFGFSYEEIPELCNTLPALELCYSMNQRFLDEQQKSPESSVAGLVAESGSSNSGPMANWRISSPGDHPDDVKARLKYWAQAVACTVRLCS